MKSVKEQSSNQALETQVVIWVMLRMIMTPRAIRAHGSRHSSTHEFEMIIISLTERKEM